MTLKNVRQNEKAYLLNLSLYSLDDLTKPTSHANLDLCVDLL